MNKDKNLLVFCALIGVLIFAYYFWPVDFVKSANVTVSATVSETVTCTASTGTTAFGTLTTSAVSTSTPDVTITMSCNSAPGCALKVKDAGNTTNPGLYSTTATNLVTSTTATLTIGTAGYGIQGTTTDAGSGGTLTIATVYNKTGNDVGGLSLTDLSLSSSSVPIANRETVVKHKAAISGLTKAATDYSDTITYSCIGNS